MSRTSAAKRRHASMVGDPLRTRPLLRAIRRAVQEGDVVVDIGTGTGILAIAAARAGASHVWAIDCDSSAMDVARRAARRTGVGDRITFVEGISFAFETAARADLVVCETVGSFAFDENILAALADAKRRLLKRSGRIIPCRLELWGAPCRSHPPFKRGMEAGRIKKKDLLGPPSRLISIDFSKRISDRVHIHHRFHMCSSGTMQAIAVWPKATWWDGEITDASPLGKPTHWKQGILPVEPRRVRAGRSIKFELIIGPHPADPCAKTERLWRC